MKLKRVVVKFSKLKASYTASGCTSIMSLKRTAVRALNNGSKAS
jgi:hypothetical protein